VDDILIIYDQNRTNEDSSRNIINNNDEQLEFKVSGEENRIINYLDLSINRNTNNLDLSIYRKPTYMDITIHFSSNHPLDHRLAAFQILTLIE
jgi:predicted nucleotidyltransferase component of viral defense system